MRKYLLIIIAAILAILCLIIMIFGIHIGPINLYSYSDVKEATINKEKIVEDLNKKNTNDFPMVKKALTTATTEYNTKKSEYDTLVSQGVISADALTKAMDLFDADTLGTTMQNYANSHKVNLQFDIKKSESSTAISSEYVMCDLVYNITGEYIAITDFLYSIENDSSLNFEIGDFSIKQNDTKIEANFIVKDVPIKTQSLLNK